MNVAIVLGRLTRDPVIKATQSGMTIARFTLAVNRLNKKGQNPEADFINCVAFGKTAMSLAITSTKASGFGGRQNPDRELYQQERREEVYYRNLGEPGGVHREAF